MNNKKGFTLVELLAVVSILSLLVIIALPNIVSMFNDAKKNSFLTECKQIYKTAQQEWMKDSMFETNDQVYTRCKTCTGKTLSLSGRKEIDYYVKVNKAGQVIRFYATDGTYQYGYDDGDLLITDIADADALTDLNEDSIIDIGTSGPTIKGKQICKYKLIVDKGSFSNLEDVKEYCFNIVNDGYVFNDNYTGWYQSNKTERYKHLSLIVDTNKLRSSNDWVRVYNNSSKEKLLGEINYSNKPKTRCSLNYFGDYSGINSIGIILGEYDRDSVYVEKSNGMEYSLMYTYTGEYNRSYSGPWITDSSFVSALDTVKESLRNLGYSYIGFKSCNSYGGSNEVIFGDSSAPIAYSYPDCKSNEYYISYYDSSVYQPPK